MPKWPERESGRRNAAPSVGVTVIVGNVSPGCRTVMQEAPSQLAGWYWLVSLASHGNHRDKESEGNWSSLVGCLPDFPDGVSGEVAQQQPGGLLRVDRGSLGVVPAELLVQAGADPRRASVPDQRWR